MASLELETIKTLSQFSNLKAYYRFSDDALTTDSSGEGNTLTAIGTPTENASGKFGGAVTIANLTPSAWYKFDTGALTTDSSGNSNTLTAISDPAEAGGAHGGATGSVVFDANDGYSRADDADFKPTGSFTVGFWFKATTNSTVLLQSYSANTNIAGWKVRIQSGGGVAFYSGKNTGTVDNTDFNAVSTASGLNDGNWHFIVCGWNDTTDKTFISADGGNFVEESWAYAPVYAATSYIRIGCGNDAGSDGVFSQATMDDVFILNGVAIDQDTVNSLYLNEVLLRYSAYSATDHADFKPTTSFTAGMWLETTSASSSTLFQSYSQNTNRAGWRILMNAAGTIQFLSGKNTGTTSGTDFQLITSSGAVNDGNWNFVVATWDGSHLRVYINGSSGASAVSWANAPGYAATNYVRVGCGSNDGTNGVFLTGSIDDVFLLNGTALSAPQIKEIYEGWILTASAGSFTLTGVAATFSRGYTLLASLGTFALTGFDVILKRTYILVAELGEFALTGYDAVFTRAYTLVAGTGEFILTGVNALLNKGITLVASTGSFIITGKDVILRQALNLICSVGEFTLTGYDVILKRTYILVAETGSFILTGFSSTLSRGYTLVAEAGSFVLTGIDIVLSRGYNLIAETGVFSITVKSVQFLFNGIATYWGKITKSSAPTYTKITKSSDDIWTNITKLN